MDSGEEKKPCPCQESNPGHPAHGLVTVLTELPQQISDLQQHSIQLVPHVGSTSSLEQNYKVKNSLGPAF
jgi:hypothetical protein